ncbi:hypothetical protein [Rossellomorea marisflavi]|uniref:hypothetical protein n=1 Tax=Rossellomorea marisflavi TaxID=189381 RepID=UPI0034597E2A
MKDETKTTIITAGLNLLPYVGGSIATVYSSMKDKKEKERLELFFSETSESIKKFDEKFTSILEVTTHDDEYLTMLIEKISRIVEKEARKSKRDSLKSLLINSLLHGVDNHSYGQLEFFADALDSLSEQDVIIMIALYKEENLVVVNSINISDTNDPYYVLASINKIRAFGFLESFTGDFHIGAVDNELNQSVKVSQLGKLFVDFCLKTA